MIQLDCPYCFKPMGIHKTNSTSGVNGLKDPKPEPWHYEIYLCSCKHDAITISVNEYYYPQVSNHDEYSRLCKENTKPLSPIGYPPLDINPDFEGTIEMDWICFGHVKVGRYSAACYASRTETPYITIDDEEKYCYGPCETIECPSEWLSYPPQKVRDLMKDMLEKR